MPRIITRSTPKPSARSSTLVQELVNALRNDQPGQPIVNENHLAKDTIHIQVIWDAWYQAPDEERTAVILAAYEQVEGAEFKDRIALAQGLTFPEAAQLGIMPYVVTALRREGDPYSLEQIREEMVKDGASILTGHPVLRFFTLEQADECRRRLIARMPRSDAMWVIYIEGTEGSRSD